MPHVVATSASTREGPAPSLGPTHRIRTAYLFWLIGGVLSLGGSSWARAAEEPPPPAITTAEIERAQKAVQESTDLSAEAKKSLDESYTKALDDLHRAEELNAEAAKHRTLRQNAPAEVEKIKAELAQPTKPPEITPPESPTLDQLKQQQANAEAQRREAEQALNDIKDEIKRRAERSDQLASIDSTTKARLEKVNQQLESLASATEPIEPAQRLAKRAKRIALLAERTRLQAERAAHAEELPRYEATGELMRLRRDLATRQLNQAEAVEQQWKNLVAERSRTEAVSDVLDTKRDAFKTPQSLQFLVDANQKLTKLRESSEGPAQSALAIEREAKQVERQRQQLSEQFKYITSVADLTGNLTGNFAQLLLDQRAKLPDVRKLRNRIEDRQERISEIKFKMIDLQTQRTELADIDHRVQEIMDSLQPPEGYQQLYAQRARELLQSQRNYLDALIEDYERYQEALKRLDKNERELLAETIRDANYINERILWLASVDPVGPDSAKQLWPALRWLGNPRVWQDILSELAQDLRRYPLLYLLAIGVALALFLPQHRARRRITAIAEDITTNYSASFRPTIETLLLTVLIAAPWPALLAFVGWRLEALPLYNQAEASALADAVGAGLWAAAMAFLTVELSRQICRRHGLAEAHFLWSEESVRSLRHNLHWLLPVAPPLTFLIATFHGQSDSGLDASLGRLAFCVAMLILAYFAQRILRPLYDIVIAQAGQDSVVWLKSLRFLWYPGAVVVPLLLAGIAALGYYYTAMQLTWRAQETLWLILGLLVCHSLLLRGLLVARRSLAIQQARRRREAAQEQDKEEPGETATPENEALLVLDLSAIDKQIRRLLRSGFALVLFFGLWYIWVDVLPALRGFNDLLLWSYEGGEVTLGNLVVALVVMFMTVIAGRNLPGLLEIAWLRYLPLDAGVRYATTTIFRYFITVLGLVIAFETVGIGWSHVQWLVAAATVGLGFGLQEIFANFVSGLIILLERPMRVGDLVTVAGVNGRISRIRFRATTILTWDRKELIVPNKEFITGQLTNWTLSDTTVRQVIKIGIAYGSDTELATKLLYEIAKENPQVQRDPAPMVLFDEFGDNALTFELRYFANIDDDLIQLRHAMNMAVDRTFRQANIEIAFPQRDIHIRSLDLAPEQIEELARRARGPA